METTLTHEKTGNPEQLHEAKYAPLLNRVDLLAMILVSTGLFFLALMVIVLAIYELAQLISGLWQDTTARSVMMVFSTALAWLIVRWNKNRLS